MQRQEGMSEARFSEFIRDHKNKMASYRQQIAYYVVKLGYEPQSWLETLAIARELTATRGNNA